MLKQIRSVFKPDLFSNQVAIVTGGGTGIGAAIAQELAHLGCKVVIASRNKERLEHSCEDMLKSHPSLEIFPLQCNIRKEDDVKRLISGTLEKYGRLDFLVNNGGGQFRSRAEDVSAKVSCCHFYWCFYPCC